MVTSEYPPWCNYCLIYCNAYSREEENGVTIFRFALKRSFSNKTNLVFLTLFPITCIFLPAENPRPFLPYGNQYYGMLILFFAIRLASIILEDIERGEGMRIAFTSI